MTEVADRPAAAAPAPQGASLVVRIAERYGVAAPKLLDTLKATAFKTDKPISNETMMALLIVADQYKLNPFTRELYAFPDKRGGIVPVVSIDGWIRITNEHPQYDGVQSNWDAKEKSQTCTMFRKDRSHPTIITEYMDECIRATDPWRSHPRRMLRHKAFIQAARVAFGFAGIYDEDEAQRIAEQRQHVVSEGGASAADRVRDALSREAASAGDVVDVEPRERAVFGVYAPDAPPPRDRAELLAELLATEDEDAAALVLDEARTTLSAVDRAELLAAWEAARPTTPNED